MGLARHTAAIAALPALLLALHGCATGKRNVAPVPAAREADAIVYGGTSAGVAAAVRLARLGREVVLLSPDVHLGGLSSSGLGWTDTGEKSVIGGLAREFYGRIFEHYARDEAWRWQARDEYGNRGQGTPAIDGAQRTMWIFEPHVAEAVFEALIAESGVQVVRDAWLDRRPGGVEMDSGRIESLRTLDGRRWRASVFIDATYEGDLMAAAGVSYRVGREANDEYGETWNGVQPDARHHGHHFTMVSGPVDPYVIQGDPSSGLIAKVGASPLGAKGAGDAGVQAYCFRMCLTDVPGNRVPFVEPEGYDEADYELMARVFEAGWRDTIPPSSPIPNRKTDTNNHGPMSTDNVGANHDYPEASYARRQEIIAEHERYQRGWLWFLRTSPRVPEATRAQMTAWGLAADEFTDNDNWPYQLYVREARRMVGESVVTEHEVMGRRPVAEPIGMGSYTMDSHNVWRYVTADGRVENEGDLGVRPPGPYAIDRGAITPLPAECTNLLVPVCVSATHIAFGSIRMEPVFMVLGDAAACAAHLAIEADCDVQAVPYATLRSALLEHDHVLEVAPALAATLERRRAEERARSVPPRELGDVVVDDLDATFRGAWARSVASPRFVGAGYRHDGDRRDGSAEATFRARVPAAGTWEVRLAWPHGPNRATNVPVTIEADGHAPSSLRIDQRARPSIDGLAEPIARLQLAENAEVRVTLHDAGTDGHVIADAIALVRVDGQSLTRDGTDETKRPGERRDG